MSNCAVNNCKHTVTPWDGKSKLPDRAYGGAANPMCNNVSNSTLYGGEKNQADQVLKDCKSGKGCFTNYKCVDGKDCDVLFTDLMKNGWGDKDVDTSVLHKINHASPENLRDQLKYEMCRRVACMPIPTAPVPTGWEWIRENFLTPYTSVIYVLSLVPVMWILFKVLQRYGKDDINNIPTVLAGGGNSKKNGTAVGLYMVVAMAVMIILGMIFGKYSINVSFGLLGAILLALTPLFSFGSADNTSQRVFVILLLAVKIGLVAMVGRFITANKDKFDKGKIIQNISGAGIASAILYGIIGIVVVLYCMNTKNVGGAVITSVVCLVALIMCALKGANPSETEQVNDALTIISSGIVVGGIFAILAVVFPQNAAFNIASALIVFNILSQMDGIDMLGPLSDMQLTGALTLAALVIGVVVPLGVKNISNFTTSNQYLMAASFFSTSAAMAGTQTFLGVVAPPILLTMLVLQRMVNIKAKMGASNTWDFLFSGNVMTRMFNYIMEKENITDGTKLFDTTQSIGVKNDNIFS